MLAKLRAYSRYTPWWLCILSALLIVSRLSLEASLPTWLFAVFFIWMSFLGLSDVLQKNHAILRNYPVSGHLRFLFETFRPEIRQYLLESDTEKLPFSRNERALVYQRAKGASDKRPLGTIEDVYKSGAEWLAHTANPTGHIAPNALRTLVGGKDCTQPYAISVFNVSAMSFGALSANAIMALNKGAQMGGFAHDTGEGSVSAYHRKHGGDLIWELGSGYFGCRTAEGTFDRDLFAKVANDPQIKMIEIKMSQGAKPGHGGVLPAAKITPEIAITRGIPLGQDCVSPAAHSAFRNPLELMYFIAELRQLSNGKPIGFKLCIGKLREWFALVKAMMETGITPDFIVIDGSEGGTGAAPVEFVDHVGTPMRDGLRLVHATLVGAGLRSEIKLGASGKIISAFDITRACAIGADWCNSARGFMFAVGCIQSRTCHTDLCPTGVATQDAMRQKALDPEDKAHRVFHYHQNTLIALGELLSAAGYQHPSELSAESVIRRTESGKAAPLSHSLLALEEGELLSQEADLHLDRHFAGLGKYWLEADIHQW
ncbi:FMN-binding glutamate synthase family protein [Polynucleobacter kasalickyi]|uniref:Glutamate synthase (NADPH) large subunit n=1 Tax=Polynucleobacter kasalickyi TaxID=1938817 RepID=A0A1W1Y3K8_9BURK|nr:FMN-binding glutamate synthase family protein [Polynucleobacter kasalickyi]SMC30742.1 glutamate synthase (NADPH) large subunit [Polynucleobacter kasalickyi]